MVKLFNFRENSKVHFILLKTMHEFLDWYFTQKIKAKTNELSSNFTHCPQKKCCKHLSFIHLYNILIGIELREVAATDLWPKLYFHPFISIQMHSLDLVPRFGFWSLQLRFLLLTLHGDRTLGLPSTVRQLIHKNFQQ